MIDILISAFYLTLPLVISGALHMVVVKTNFLPFLAKPINAKLFGTHKTWRGILAMPALTVLGLYLVFQLEPSLNPYLLMPLKGQNFVTLGILLGLGYTLPELPNSWIKRRMGVPEGKLPTNNRALFFLLDHLDSTVGISLVYFLMLEGPIAVPVAVLFLGPIIHTCISILLWSLGLRKEPV